MGRWDNLAARLERAGNFHFHFHIDFNLTEFIRSLKDDVALAFDKLDPGDFFSTKSRCAVCSLPVDPEHEGTISQDVRDEDGVLMAEYFYHESCAPTEVLDSLEDSEDDDD